MQLSRELKIFSEFSSQFLKYASNFRNFEKKKMTVIAYVFPKLQTVKDIVRQMFK